MEVSGEDASPDMLEQVSNNVHGRLRFFGFARGRNWIRF